MSSNSAEELSVKELPDKYIIDVAESSLDDVRDFVIDKIEDLDNRRSVGTIMACSLMGGEDSEEINNENYENFINYSSILYEEKQVEDMLESQSKSSKKSLIKSTYVAKPVFEVYCSQLMAVKYIFDLDSIENFVPSLVFYNSKLRKDIFPTFMYDFNATGEDLLLKFRNNKSILEGEIEDVNMKIVLLK